LLTPSEAAKVIAIRHRQNVSACGYGLGQCNEGLLTPSEAAQASVIRHRQNVAACEYGLMTCSERLMSPSEIAHVRSTTVRRVGVQAGYAMPSLNQAVVLPPAPVIVPPPPMYTPLNALIAPTTSPVAENGSYYGQPNQNGVPKTVLVQGYTKSNGTYVQGYYRSAPGTNPLR
jgi:hypothetical protein